MIFKKMTAAAVLATLAVSSFAAPNGVYVGASVGVTKSEDNDEQSFGGLIGYRANEHFAVEAGYAQLGKWEFGGGMHYQDKVENAAISALGILPLGNQFSVYGRLGFTRLYHTRSYGLSKLEDNDLKPLYGVGVGYDFGGNISARLEVQKPSARFTNIGASVIYSF
jgi:OOP family OmpA-OmpF porin